MTTPDAEPKTLRKDRIDAFAATLLVGFAALLGLNQALVKLVNAGFAPLFQGGLRSACAFVLILGFALITRKRLSITDGSLGFGLLNGLLFAGEFALLFVALDLTSVARVSLFFYTMPFFVAVGAHFLFPGERLTAIRLAGLGLAIAGVTLALFAGNAGDTASSSGTTDAWLGDVLALLAAAAWAGIALLTRATRLADIALEQNLLYQLSVSAVVLLGLAVLTGETVREPTAAILGIFAFQVVFVASFGFLLWLWVLSVYPVSNMASFSLLTPLFAVFSGWLIFDEQLGAVFFVALGLVAAGLLLVNR